MKTLEETKAYNEQLKKQTAEYKHGVLKILSGVAFAEIVIALFIWWPK